VHCHSVIVMLPPPEVLCYWVCALSIRNSVCCSEIRQSAHHVSGDIMSLPMRRNDSCSASPQSLFVPGNVLGLRRSVCLGNLARREDLCGSEARLAQRTSLRKLQRGTFSEGFKRIRLSGSVNDGKRRVYQNVFAGDFRRDEQFQQRN